MTKTLIIEIPYGGMGDHLFHSHLPRVAKQFGNYSKVYISNKSLFRHNDIKKLVWELNPFIDGFVDEEGVKCDLNSIVPNIKADHNLLDEVMFSFNLNDGLKYHEPEVFYKPKFIEEYNKTIYDPNFLSWVGNIEKEDVMYYIRKNKILIEAIMKKRSDKFLYINSQNQLIIETPTLFDFCDLVYSSKKLYCLTSGTATLAAALKKPVVAFYGNEQGDGFRHSTQHKYILITPRPFAKIFNKLNRLLTAF